MIVKDIITEKRAIELIYLLVPYLQHTEISIDHIGNFDKDGCRHIDAVAVIQFNKHHQITIWNKGIKFYNGYLQLGESVENDVANVFDVYRLLYLWGLIS